MYKIICTITIILCNLFFFSGCSNNTIDKNTLRIASSDYTTINPILNSHDELPDIIFSGLMSYDVNGEPIPELAETYTYDPKTLTYTFKLRDNVKWHDNAPFSAEDVKFTLDLLKNNQLLSSSITDNYQDIDSTSIIDPTHIKIKLKRPNAAMLDYLTIGILPKHLLENKDIMTDKFNQHPIGTGKYKFVSWESGQNIIVEKNNQYYKKIPQINKIIFKIIPDENARALQMKEGQLDLALLNAHNTIAFNNSPKFRVYDFKTADYRAIAPNFLAPFWKRHPELVSTLGYALDKQAIINAALNGEGTIAYSPIQFNPKYNNTNINQYNYNLNYFHQKMTALGWKRGSDGIYEKNGEKLEFSIDVRENEKERIDIATICAQQFKQAGINMHINIVSKLDWQHLESFLIGQASPFDPDNGTYVLFTTNGSGNYTHYSNPLVDKYLALAREGNTFEDRKIAYDKFQKIWSDNPAYIMIAYLKGHYVATPELKGLSTDRLLGHHAVGIMWNIEDWSLDR